MLHLHVRGEMSEMKEKVVSLLFSVHDDDGVILSPDPARVFVCVIVVTVLVFFL